VLLVSHDREFLNNVVTQTIASDGPGIWNDYVGGYDDWLAQRRVMAPETESKSASTAEPAAQEKNAAVAARPKPAKAARLSNWESRELDGLPDAVAKLEAEQAELSGKLADGSLYRDAPDEVNRINERIAAIDKELETKLERWEALEARRDGN